MRLLAAGRHVTMRYIRHNIVRGFFLLVVLSYGSVFWVHEVDGVVLRGRLKPTERCN